ncbi:hypothetical protein AJ79_05142 [Helicocarpus griseus UAMH5409]|uniref:Methyltransferase domain-containing protein n=1 Tax=Helicocarpus griseus UAMH5409 TaxID=1447875 RepID=A0A2B7XQE3_9EURO|nr:hypothetical protein AJ79_05142 [Helicocarpus griseus UAMH5409]
MTAKPVTTEEQQLIAVDPEIEVTESTYGAELSVYTASVTSSVTDYQKENGRRYHAYKEGRELHTSFLLLAFDKNSNNTHWFDIILGYLLPNDERENDRLDLHHALIRLAMKDKLFFAPIGKFPNRVLDICTGTADMYPSAEVIGNDLSPIQPSMIPPNVKFLIDDVEDEWGYENQPFDFIHARYLAGSVKDMPRLLEQCYANVKPGGWVEFQDWDAAVQSADGTIKGTSFEQYTLNTIAAFEKAGFITRPGIYLEKWLKDAGFVNTRVEKLVIPVGTWPKDEHYKRVGAFNLLHVEETLEAGAVAALTRIENWSKQEVDVLVAKTKQDARNPKIHAEYNFYVVYGQKPQK